MPIIDGKDRVNFEEINVALDKIYGELKKLDFNIVLFLCAFLIAVFMVWNWGELYNELKQINEDEHGTKNN